VKNVVFVYAVMDGGGINHIFNFANHWIKPIFAYMTIIKEGVQNKDRETLILYHFYLESNLVIKQ